MKTWYSRFVPFLLIVAALSACQLTQVGDAEPTDVAQVTDSVDVTETVTSETDPVGVPDAQAVTDEVTPATTDEATDEAVLFATPTGAPRVTTAPSAIMLGGVLTWIGAREGGAGTSQPAQIAVIGTDGTVSTLFEVPDAGRPARPCGERALSPDGRTFAFFDGGDRGTLYVMQGMNTPIELLQVEYLSCLGMGTFVYSPSGGRFGLIDYVAGASRNDFADGSLRLYDTTSLAQVAAFDDIVAFDLGETDAAFLRFFANGQGVADEAAVIVWDGTSEREVATLVPTEPNCRFTSGQIIRPNADALLLMGQRCSGADSGTRWQLYAVSAADGTITLVNSDAQPGAFVTFARTNTLLLSPDRETVYFSVPDGVTANTVAIAAIDQTDLAISVTVARQAVYPNFSGTEQALPLLSPDGTRLAVVVSSPDGDNQLALLSLDTPDEEPRTFSAGTRGDRVLAMAFDAPSQALYYVGGGEDNAVFVIDLATGTERRITRGRFGPAIALQGDQIALLDARRETDPAPLEYLDLVIVNASTGAKRTIFQGERQPGGATTYAVPLVWR